MTNYNPNNVHEEVTPQYRLRVEGFPSNMRKDIFNFGMFLAGDRMSMDRAPLLCQDCFVGFLIKTEEENICQYCLGLVQGAKGNVPKKVHIKVAKRQAKAIVAEQLKEFGYSKQWSLANKIIGALKI